MLMSLFFLCSTSLHIFLGKNLLAKHSCFILNPFSVSLKIARRAFKSATGVATQDWDLCERLSNEKRLWGDMKGSAVETGGRGRGHRLTGRATCLFTPALAFVQS